MREREIHCTHEADYLRSLNHYVLNKVVAQIN